MKRKEKEVNKSEIELLDKKELVKEIIKQPEEIIKKGDAGIITAYLPEDNTFGIFFGDGKWYTFKDPEEWFLNNFEIIQEPAE